MEKTKEEIESLIKSTIVLHAEIKDIDNKLVESSSNNKIKSNQVIDLLDGQNKDLVTNQKKLTHIAFEMNRINNDSSEAREKLFAEIDQKYSTLYDKLNERINNNHKTIKRSTDEHYSDIEDALKALVGHINLKQEESVNWYESHSLLTKSRFKWLYIMIAIQSVGILSLLYLVIRPLL